MKIKNCVAEIQVRYSVKVKKADRVRIKNSEETYQLLLQIFEKETLEYQEAFYILFLNRSGEVLGYRCISKGGISGTVVDKRHIFGLALKCNASSIVLSHNHPSSTLQPSQLDINLTKDIVKAGELLDILVLDHLIITAEDYFSFADEGMI